MRNHETHRYPGWGVHRASRRGARAWLRWATALAVIALALFCPLTLEAGPNLVIILDDSGSMSMPLRSAPHLRKIDAAKQALLTVLEQVPPDSQIGLLALNVGGQSNWIIPLGPVNRKDLRSAINRIEAEGGTPLGQALKMAADALLELREKQRYGTYKLLVVTDGEATDGQLVETYLPEVLTRGLSVDVIGVDMQAQHSLATRVQTYRRADDPGSLTTAIEQLVLGESSGDDGAAGGSDYELLAGLPEEVAAAAITALTQVRNDPITGRSSAGAPLPQPGPVANLPAAVPQEAEPERSSSWLFIVGAVVLLAVANVIFRALGRGQQRGRRRR